MVVGNLVVEVMPFVCLGASACYFLFLNTTLHHRT